MNESYTLYQAIALLAYRDEDLARRYGALPGIRMSGRERRKQDFLYPANSNLPGTETFRSIRDENELRKSVQSWKDYDGPRWLAGQAQLWRAVQCDDVPAFATMGKVGVEFWLTHDLDSPEVQYFRFIRSDLMRLLHRCEEGLYVGTPPVVTEWRSVETPRLVAWLARFQERQRVDGHWAYAIDLANWYSEQRGAVADAESLYDEACQQIFRSLLDGDFVDLERTPCIRPHLLNDTGVSRMLPEHAEWLRGVRWSGQCDQDDEQVLPSGLLRQLMCDVWLPARFVAGWCQVRQIAVPPWLPRPLARVEKLVASMAQLPNWLSLMETIAWIVSRSPQIVSYADPERNARRVFFIEHTLPNGKRIGGSDTLPPGMTLGWLDAFAACDPDTALPADEAVSELLNALRVGRITARGIWAATGERRDMESDEWRSLSLDSPPRKEQFLFLYRFVPGSLAKLPEHRWKDVLLPAPKLLELWAPVNGTPLGEVRSPVEMKLTSSPGYDGPGFAAGSVERPLPSKNGGGRPRSWDWDAFDREMMRLANTPDGLPDRPTLQKHMLDWCEKAWGKSPSDSMVRARVARIYPE